jgi:excisionase family DNA binding protein
MLTVPEVARRAGRNPETIRRWIREGKLPARKIGTQHVIDETDLESFLGGPGDPASPDAERWSTPIRAHTSDVSAAIRLSRASVLAGLIADGRVTPALEHDTQDLKMPAMSSTGVTATTTLLEERERDRR